MTETLIFIAILGLLFLQLLGRFLKRMQASEADPEQHSAEELAKQTLPERPPDTSVFAQPYPPVLPHVAIQQAVATRKPRPHKLREPSTRADQKLLGASSLRAGVMPRDRASLRRAIVLMELLGPPRGLDRPDTHRNY